MNAKKVTAYVCPICKMVHPTAMDAKDCCEPVVEMIDAYRCSVCKDFFESEQDAECCECKDRVSSAEEEYDLLSEVSGGWM